MFFKTRRRFSVISF